MRASKFLSLRDNIARAAVLGGGDCNGRAALRLRDPLFSVMGHAMAEDRTGQIAVIFISQRTDADDAGYAAAAAEMEALASAQPGYRGIDSARGPDGLGITVSYWADEASAVAWRGHANHAATRARGRESWYRRYEVAVAAIGRSYHWERA